MERTNALRGLSRRVRSAVVVAAVALSLMASAGDARAAITYGADVSYDLVFPVEGDHYFTDTFGAYRSHGKGHQGTDVFAVKGTPIVAAASGTVRYVNWTARSHLNPDRCCSVVIRHDDGWETRYLHLNNDDPGTDNGKAWGIAKGIVPGARVEAGQLIGWNGDSGNAENTPPHLHFELLDPNGVHANPFLSLLLAGGNQTSETDPEDDSLLGSGGLLRRGDRGDDVARLQELLTDLGYEPGPADGIFGPRTGAAVMAFQSDHGLIVDGLVGSQTRGAVAGLLVVVSDTLALGSRGDDVAEIQRILSDLGFAPGPADGVFGPRTLRAILDFQREYGLLVDGLVGPQTMSRLGMR